MPESSAFRPFTLAAQRLSVGDTATTVTLPENPGYSSTDDMTVWVENRGTTELLIEVGTTTPSDTLSYPIPAQSSQPISVGLERTIKLKRMTGSASGVVVVTAGEGL